MTIAFACPGCKSIWKVPDECAGRTTRCRTCGTALLVPDAPAAPAVAAAPATDTVPHAVAALPSHPPFFHALAVFACKSNRQYRIYIRPDELVFIWAGAGMEGVAGAQAGAMTGGLIGALIGALFKKALDPTRKNAARRSVLDAAPLEQLIGDHKKNLRAPIDDFEEVRIGPRSERHARLYSDHGHQALLYLRHRSFGKYRLGIASVDDVRIALAELPRVFGEMCRVEIEWSEEEKKFVKRKEPET